MSEMGTLVCWAAFLLLSYILHKNLREDTVYYRDQADRYREENKVLRLRIVELEMQFQPPPDVEEGEEEEEEETDGADYWKKGGGNQEDD